jgi:hypothetical protein
VRSGVVMSEVRSLRKVGRLEYSGDRLLCVRTHLSSFLQRAESSGRTYQSIDPQLVPALSDFSSFAAFRTQ